MLFLDGKAYYIPNVYGVIKVTNLGGVALPNFNVGVLVGNSNHGIPFNATGKKGYELIKGYTNVQALRKDHGVCTLEKGFRYAKKQGAGVVFVLGATPHTQAKGILLDGAVTPAHSVLLKSKLFWGAAGNDISITIATVTTTQTYTLIPPKNTKYLTTDSGTDTSIEVRDVEGLSVGDTVYLTSNTYALPISKVIADIIELSGGYRITFSEAIATTALVADYARIFQPDTTNQKVKAFTAAGLTISDVMTWLNTLDFIEATMETGATLVPADLAKTYFQNLHEPTKGTSPNVTVDVGETWDTPGGTWDTLVDALPQLMEEFALSNKLDIRLICPLTPTAGSHSAFDDLAVAQREKNKPLQIIVGCATGDIMLAESDSSNPIKRTLALNSDDVILCGCGKDDLPSYYTFAPMVLGNVIANSPNHNLTRDLLNCNSTEKYFGDANTEEYARYLRAGVIITETRKTGFHISQGVNSFQNQAATWDDITNKTYLIFNRQMADFCMKALTEQLDTLVGTDGVTMGQAERKAVIVLENLKTNGFMTDYRIISIERSQNAYIVKVDIQLPDVVDFIGIIMNIIVP